MFRRIWIIPVLAAALVACERDMMSEKGFALPKGNPATVMMGQDTPDKTKLRIMRLIPSSG